MSLRWWQRWQTTLLGAFLFVAVIVLVAQVADVVRDYKRAVDAALVRQHDTAVALSRATRLFVDRYLLGAAVVAESLARVGGRDRAAVRPLLEPLQQGHPGVTAFVLDASGRVLTSAPEDRGGEDRSDQPLFRAVSAGASSVVTTVGSQTPVLVVGVAAREPSGRLRGVVATTIPAAALGQELRIQLMGGAQALVVDADGLVLVHGAYPDARWSRRDFSGVPLVAEALAGRASSSRGYLSPLTQDWQLGAMVPVAGLGWAAGVVEPAAVALAPARRERAAALWVAASLLVLSLAMALVLSAWLYRPIERLAAGAAAFAGGNFAYRVRIQQRNELGWLAERLNEMGARMADTTRQLRAAVEDARGERRRLATTLESIPDGVLVCDADGQLVLANEAARRILGERFVPGAPLAEVGMCPETRTLAGDTVPPDRLPLRRALTGEGIHDLRLAVNGPDGQLRYVSATAAPVERRPGERLGAVAVVRDVTDRQALESLKDQFIARASHELRTPLTAIRGTLGFLRRSLDGQLADVPRELLGIALRNSDQMLRLVEDLLDASRLSSGALRLVPERLDAAEVVNQAVRLVKPLADDTGVKIVASTEPGLGVDADPLKLDQVLANLLGNAVKFTHQGGRVEVTARHADAHVEIRVVDQGIGLAREHLERVFEPFFQVECQPRRTRPRGTGLGLTIARSLVELHGGQIWAESAGPGRGSTFVVRLPAKGDVGGAARMTELANTS